MKGKSSSLRRSKACGYRHIKMGNNEIVSFENKVSFLAMTNVTHAVIAENAGDAVNTMPNSITIFEICVILAFI